MYHVILFGLKIHLNWKWVLLSIVFYFTGLPIYAGTFPILEARNKGFKLLVPGIGRDRCLIPFPVPSPPGPIKMLGKYEQVISVDYSECKAPYACLGWIPME